MRVVVALDKFKGSLTAAEAAAAVREGVQAVWPQADVVVVPVGDGGDGTLEAAVAAGFRAMPVTCCGPTGDPVPSGFAVRETAASASGSRLAPRSVAVVELADSCGLLRLPGDPDAHGDGVDEASTPRTLRGWDASTFGLGQVMAAALDAGCDELVVGLGGSASTDGGLGMLQALGLGVLTASGDPVAPGAAGLHTVDRVDASHLHPRLREVTLVAATDVNHPLLGQGGAAAVFGPQKGLDAAQVLAADEALAGLADRLEPLFGADGARDRPGAGAAGGTGWGLMLLGATVRRGIDVVLDWSSADELIAGADLVITGEGSLDEQSLAGKTPLGVAERAVAAGVPVAALSGRRTLSEAQLAAAGFVDAVALTELQPDPELCLVLAAPLLTQATHLLLGRLGDDPRASS